MSKQKQETSLFNGVKFKSSLFNSDKNKKIEKRIFDYLNTCSKTDLGISTSVRTAGDKIPKAMEKCFNEIFKNIATNIQIPTTRKKIANFIFDGKEDGMRYYLNVTTHNTETDFSMPNITAIDNLHDLYMNNYNIFVVVLIDYKPSLSSNYILKVQMFPIESLTWDCLRFGNIGTGQIQIKRASKINLAENYNRKEWMNKLSEKLFDFFKKEDKKLKNGLDKANSIHEEWLAREDVWK